MTITGTAKEAMDSIEKFQRLHIDSFVPAWDRLFSPMPAPSNVLFLRFYGEENRFYHNFDHINNLEGWNVDYLGLIKETVDQDEKDAITVAIWFHDIIYDARRRDNEETSAMLFDLCTPLGNVTKKRSIFRAIVDTKHDNFERHTKAKYIQYLLDLDLHGFSEPYETMSETTTKIRKEFAHLSDENWLEGRIKFLKGLLDREAIFYNPYNLDIFGQKEKYAIENIKKELEGLGTIHGT